MKSHDLATFRVGISADISQVQGLSVAVREFLLSQIGDCPAVHETELALVEACNNIALHAYPYKTERQWIEVITEVDHDGLSLEIRDIAPPRPPFLPPPPRMGTGPLQEVPESGYGLTIIHQLMDRVKDDREDGWNILRLYKTFQPPTW